MQELKNVHLDPSTGPVEQELARAAREADQRRRQNHSGGGSGVQFSTIFSMVDQGLESGAETLRRMPKRGPQKETESEKSQEPVPVAAVEVKAQTAEAPKEAPKAKTEQDAKPKSQKETAAKKVDLDEKAIHQAQIAQAQAAIQAQQAVRPVERVEIKASHRDSLTIEKPKVAERGERRVEQKETSGEFVKQARGPAQFELNQASEQGKVQERRAKPKTKEDESSAADHRDERKMAEGQKAVRADDESARAAKTREKPEEKPVVAERQETKPNPFERKLDEGELSEKRKSDDSSQAEAGAKKRSISDLEKMTGLNSRTILETVAIPPPTVDITLKPLTEGLNRGIAVDSVKASARSVPASSSSGQQQYPGNADAQHAKGSGEKLGETARRLASYLNGKTEQVVKPEAAFSDMVTKAKLFMDNGRTEMNIQLKPEHLGSLNIKMVVEDGQMQAKFVTDRPEVKELIEQNIDLLKQKLSDVGIDVASVNVEVRNDAGEASREDGRPSGLRKVTEFGNGDEPGSDGSGEAVMAYALAGMGTHLSLVA